MKRLLNYLSLLGLFIWGATVYAFVFDCEPLTAVDHYDIERDVFEHNPDNYGVDFISFGEWLERNEQAEARMQEWLSNMAERAGETAVQLFDPWYDYRDTTEGHSATAPPDWNRGERD